MLLSRWLKAGPDYALYTVCTYTEAPPHWRRHHKANLKKCHTELKFVIEAKWLKRIEKVISFYSKQEAQLSQRNRAAACLNFGKNISANSVHLTLLYMLQH